jgi:hypothetical protein
MPTNAGGLPDSFVIGGQRRKKEEMTRVKNIQRMTFKKIPIFSYLILSI